MAKEKEENTFKSSKELLDSELLKNQLGEAKPFSTAKYGDDEVMFFDKKDGFVHYAYLQEGKAFISSMILKKVEVDDASLSGSELHKVYRDNTSELILAKLNGEKIKETYQED